MRSFSQFNKLGGMEGVRRFLANAPEIKAVGLLKYVTTVVAFAVYEFVAADFFKEDISAEAKVKISYPDGNFKKFFLGKIEEEVEAAELTVSQLVKRSLDAPILAEFGNRAETKLAHLWELLAKQQNSKEGIPLRNDRVGRSI